jgi:hypothetical protein
MSLPWAVISLPTPWSRVNDPLPVAGIPVAAAACSRDASAGSCRAGPRPATVAPPVRPPHADGADGSPLDATAPPATAGSADAIRPDVIAAGPVSVPRSLSPIIPRPRSSRRRPPWRTSLPPSSIRPAASPTPAWASAQTKSPRITTADLATDPAAMSCSSPRHGPPIGVSARPPAVGLYDASDSARPGSAAGDAGASHRDDVPGAHRLRPDPSCRHVLSSSGPDPYRSLAPQVREEGRVGRTPRSPVPSLGIAGRIGGPHATVAPR